MIKNAVQIRTILILSSILVNKFIFDKVLQQLPPPSGLRSVHHVRGVSYHYLSQIEHVLVVAGQLAVHEPSMSLRLVVVVVRFGAVPFEQPQKVCDVHVRYDQIELAAEVYNSVMFEQRRQQMFGRLKGVFFADRLERAAGAGHLDVDVLRIEGGVLQLEGVAKLGRLQEVEDVGAESGFGLSEVHRFGEADQFHFDPHGQQLLLGVVVLLRADTLADGLLHVLDLAHFGVVDEADLVHECRVLEHVLRVGETGADVKAFEPDLDVRQRILLVDGVADQQQVLAAVHLAGQVHVVLGDGRKYLVELVESIVQVASHVLQVGEQDRGVLGVAVSGEYLQRKCKKNSWWNARAS